jgi:hypothetical protein
MSEAVKTLDESGPDSQPAGLAQALSFPLLAALTGRRARRFALGATILDGPLAFSSARDPMPLSEIEQLLLLCAASGNTGWHYAIARNARYAPHLSNYAGAAGGRTYPSAAGFHTSELFYTDDEGVYLFPTRDASALVEVGSDGTVDLDALLEAHRPRIKKLSEGRLDIPPEEPHMEGHNTWCVNCPGSTLLIPVGDLAQHHILVLCYLTQNGYCIFDDVHHQAIGGIERFAGLVDVEDPYPISFVEQLSLTELTVELATACYAGALTLQAMGLGGWMFDGINPFSVLGASGDENVRGLGFRFDEHEAWPLPNPTGLAGVFEAHCPPHVPDMRAAVEAVTQRKFGQGGPFNRDTPGPWKDSPRVRGAAEVHSEEFKECVALQAQYVYDHFGRFPGTVPSVHVLMYLQAHHLDLDFYDAHFSPGAYLDTHARHMASWHRGASKR